LYEPAYVVIWTTTPWTLPANQAVAAHPEFDYDLVKTERGYLVLGSQLREACLARYGLAGEVVGTTKGSSLERLELRHPFYDRKVPIILGDHVTAETGTGLVHTAPAHGLEDFAVGSHYELPVDNPVDDDGRFFASVPLVGGLSVWDANRVIIDALNDNARLLKLDQLTHSYPHCWRHKSPIIFRATRQWFIGMDLTPAAGEAPLRAIANRAVEATEFFPAWGRARLDAMIRNRPDWCVSRQRNWGVPMAFFVHKETGELHPRTAELVEAVARRVEQEGIEGWFSLQAAELLGKEADNYRKVPDTLDVWFDSGTTHAAVLPRREELAKPADMYLEGSDQHRGWFQSSLLTGCAMDGRAPYRQLLTHGFVVAGDGRKMSKSEGNAMAPQRVSDTLGAEIVRLWVASTDYSGELAISEEILKHVVEMYRRIRNTLRFLLANVSDFDPQQHMLPAERWIELDRYALAMAHDLQQEVLQDYERYEFHLAAQKLHNFCSEFLGAFYLDILKDRLYTCAAGGAARRSAQSALWHMTNSLLRLFAPILSFTAEEAWGVFASDQDDSVFLHTVYTLPQIADASALKRRWALVREVRTEVQKELEVVRVRGDIGASLQAEVEIRALGERLAALRALGDDLRFVLITSQAAVEEGAEPSVTVRGSAHQKCPRCWHYRADVGSAPAYPALCGRCVSNLHGAGEPRAHA
jgi:isoleucyl-tRNA synthetase